MFVGSSEDSEDIGPFVRLSVAEVLEVNTIRGATVDSSVVTG